MDTREDPEETAAMPRTNSGPHASLLEHLRSLHHSGARCQAGDCHERGAVLRRRGGDTRVYCRRCADRMRGMSEQPTIERRRTLSVIEAERQLNRWKSDLGRLG